ncbi:MAG: hypothetical protein KDD82_26260, partial [Planctomycetes bacterium]|nr:hypothetical protein [Planctomycetota bacterium]
LPPHSPPPGGNDRPPPPSYPAPGAQDRTPPPHNPPPAARKGSTEGLSYKGRTLPPKYPAPPSGKTETVAPGYTLGAGKSPSQRNREVLGTPPKKGQSSSSSRESFNPIGEIDTEATHSGTYEVRQRGDDFDVISGEGPVVPATRPADSDELEELLTRTQQEEVDDFDEVTDSDLGSLADSDDTLFEDASQSQDDPFASRAPLRGTANSDEIGMPPELKRTQPEALDAFGSLVDSTSDERGRQMTLGAGSSESLMRRPLDADSEIDVLSMRQGSWGRSATSAEGNAARLLRNLSQLSGQGVISDVGDYSDVKSISGELLFSETGRVDQSREGRGRTMELTQAEIFGRDPSLEQRLFESDEATPLVALAPGAPTADSLSGTGELSGEWGELSGEHEEEDDSKIVAFYMRLIRLWQGDALWILLSLGGALVGPALIWKGWEYYQTPLLERSRHALHDVLKPGGTVGLALGIAAAVLFLLNLTYVLRRRFGTLEKWVSLRLWLNLHFLFGLTGGSLVLAHSALLANNLVARLSSFAILFAVVSGIFGRYVLSHVPRYLRGEENLGGGKDREAELQERSSMAARLTDLRRVLRTGLAQFPKLRDAALEALNPPPETGLKGLLFLGPLLISDFRAMVRNRRLARELKGLMLSPEAKQARPVIQETLELLKQQSRLERRLSQAEAVRDFMDTWRALHLIMAVIVLATMFLHVVLTRFAV